MSDHCQWLVEWLQQLNLTHYLSNFETAGLTTLEQIAAVEQPILESIGITKVGHINRLQKAAESLRGQLVSMALGQDSCTTSPKSNPQIVLDESELRMPTEQMSLSNSPGDAQQVPPIPVRRSLKQHLPSSSDAKVEKTSSDSSSVAPTPVPAPRSKITPPIAAPRVHSLKHTKKDDTPASSTKGGHLPLDKSESLPVHGCAPKREIPSPKPRRRPGPIAQSSSHVPSSLEQVAGSSSTETISCFENVGNTSSLNRIELSSSSQAVADSSIPENRSVLIPEDLPMGGATVAAMTTPLPLSTTQMYVQNSGSAPPPPVRTSSKKRNWSKPSKETVSEAGETGSTGIQVSTTDHLFLKESSEEDPTLPSATPPSLPSPIPLVDKNCAEEPPGLPPKDISLSDMPDPVMPRISSLDVLLSQEVSGEDLQSSAVNESTVDEVQPDAPVSPEEDFALPFVETAVDIFAPLPTLPPMVESISPIPVEAAIARMPQDSLLEDVPDNFPPPPPPRTPTLSVPDFIAPFPPLADGNENNDSLPCATTPSLGSSPPSQSVHPCSGPLENPSQSTASTFLPSTQPPAIPSLMSYVPEDGSVSEDAEGSTIMTGPQPIQAPPLPPKDVPKFLPPPPPITDEDVPSGYSSDSESSTEEGQRMVIVSSITRRSTKGIIPLTMKHSPMSDELDESVGSPLSPVSSACSDTDKGLMTIVQQSSLRHDDIIDMEVSLTSAIGIHGTAVRRSTLTKQTDAVNEVDDMHQPRFVQSTESAYETIALPSPQTSPKHEGQADSSTYATVEEITAPPSTSAQPMYCSVKEVNPPVTPPIPSSPIPTFKPSMGNSPAQFVPQPLYSIDEDTDLPAVPPNATTQLGSHSLYSTIEDLPAVPPTATPTNKAMSLISERSSSFNLQKKPATSTMDFADSISSRQPGSVKQMEHSLSVRDTSKKHYPMPIRSASSDSTLEKQISIAPSASRVAASRLDEVPRTKEGFLHKRGGKRNEKSWQKRWVVFDGEDLKYFKNKGVKEIEVRNTVKISEMIDIKKVKDHELPEQYHRFDLVVINRVFQFYSDSEENCQMWVNVLHAAISRYTPSEEHVSKEGGSMHDPDLQGILLKQGHGRLATGFKSRYVALKGAKFAYYDSKEDYINCKPIHVLEMKLASVKPDMTPGGRQRFTITMPNNRTYVFQANSESEKMEWVEKLGNAILMGLNLAPEEKPGKRVRAEEILSRLQKNPSNKACADCSQNDPSWGVVNRGIMVCIECSGVHRSMGVHISKVRSVELDQNIWTDSLVNLMVAIGNERANMFWEKHFQGDRISSDSPREIRENFIRSKYESKSWIARSSGDTQEVLNKALCVAVTSDDIMRTTELLVCGAELSYVHPEAPESTNTPLAIARAHHQPLQIELLEQNGALITSSPTTARSPSALPVFKRGYLLKTGSDRQNWRKRFCQVDSFKGIEYYKSETDSELLGRIKVEEMVGVSQADDEALPRDSKYKHAFEVITPSRAYLFCAETDQDMHSWIDTIKKVIPDDAADRLGFDKVGYLSKKLPHKTGWKKRWFSLKDRKLTYFKKDHEEIASIDLSKMMELKGPEQGSYESKCCFHIVLKDSALHLRADTPIEADSWVQIIKQTQISRYPLSDQQLTKSGIPIIVHKCLQFVESFGLEVEGLYRKSGERAKIRQLMMAFNQDARSVVIDPDTYLVHDVTGTLKHFFQSLPDPLFTHHLYSAFLSAGLIAEHEAKMCQLQTLIDQLPPVHRDTMQRMINHLLKVIANEASNKMSQPNIISLFGPTLMTVDGDPVSFMDSQAQYNCIDLMLTYYKWLFQVDEEEEKKEEAMQNAMQKIKEAQQQHKTATMNSGMDFLISVFVGSRDGARCGMKVNALTKVADVVEYVSTCSSLTPSNYALFLVVGDSESERPLHSSEKVLGVQTGLKTDSFFCIKPNSFADMLERQPRYAGRNVNLYVRERKKWKKYPCCVKDNHFIQYRDLKCQNEHFRLHVTEVDLFIGIEQHKIDVKYPLPTRYPFCLRTRLEDSSRYLCADSTDDMLAIAVGIIDAKYPVGGIQTPLLPTKPAPTHLPPMTEGRFRGISLLHGPAPTDAPPAEYTNYKFPGKGKQSKPSGLADQRLLRELKRSVSPPSIPPDSS